MFPRSWRMQVCDWYLHPRSRWLLSSHNNMCVFFYRNGAVRRRNPAWFALQIRKLREGTARGWERCRTGSFTWADLARVPGGKELGGPSSCLFACLFLQYGTWQCVDLFPMLLKNACFCSQQSQQQICSIFHYAKDLPSPGNKRM